MVSAPNRKALSSGSTATQTMDAEKMPSIHSAPQTAAATPTAATAMPMIEVLPVRFSTLGPAPANTANAPKKTIW